MKKILSPDLFAAGFGPPSFLPETKKAEDVILCL